MSRSLNLGLLLECFNNLLNSDNDRMNFIRFVGEHNPNLLIKFYGRHDESKQQQAVIDSLNSELLAEHARLANAEQRIHTLRTENESLRLAQNNVVKDEFERIALDQDKEFGSTPDVVVEMTFVCKVPERKIHTIKWFREQSGWGLAEAKYWSEGVNKYGCTYAKALQMRETYRKFATALGCYTGYIMLTALAPKV